MFIGEAARDRLAREVDDRVHAGQQTRIGAFWIPLAFIGFGSRVPDQADHPVAAGGQEGGQLRADQPGGAGDGDGDRGQPMLGRMPVYGEVVGQLAVPVTEHRPQRDGGNRRCDAVGHPGAIAGDLFEVVGVPPPHRQLGRQRRQSVGADGVDEAPRRVVGVGLVIGHPAQTTRQAELRASVLQ